MDASGSGLHKPRRRDKRGGKAKPISRYATTRDPMARGRVGRGWLATGSNKGRKESPEAPTPSLPATLSTGPGTSGGTGRALPQVPLLQPSHHNVPVDVWCLRCLGYRHVAKDCKRPRVFFPPGQVNRHFIRLRARSRTPPGRRAPARTPSLPREGGLMRQCRGSSPGWSPPQLPGHGSPSPPPAPASDWVDPTKPKGHPWTWPRQSQSFLDRLPDAEAEEDRLRLALVAQAANGAQDIPVEDAHRAMRALAEIEAIDFLVKAFYPENFLFTFYSQAARDRALASDNIPARGTLLVLRQWTRLAHSVPSTLYYKVHLDLEGIPPHQWCMATAQQILGTSC